MRAGPCQQELPLDGGWHAGPLFAKKIRRGPILYGTVLQGRRRRAAERLAAPPWADWAAMVRIYKASRKMTEDTGVQHSVDHVVPLIHPLVCGLHVHFNLAVLPLAENLAKSNLHWPDMWGEQVDLLEVAGVTV